MNPTTIKKPTTRTSVGMETVDQTVARANQMRTGFTVPMPESVPAEALNGTYSISDVKMQRDNREQADMAAAQFNTDYNNLTGRIGNTKLNSPFTNPEQFLNGLLLRGSTDTQKALDTTGQTQADNIRGFATDYTKAGADARTQFNIPGLQESLAETRTRRAEREVKLRETLRDFETNAERRGVAREFVDAEKAKVQSDAATELADLAIIESAQLGNLNEARTEVDNILAEKKQAFEFENAAIEAEIARLEKMDTRESNARSEQLQIALQERTRNIETQLANEKEQRGYLIDAAANGADQGTLAAIRNAKSPQEAAFLASPFIGLLERRQAEASMAASYASAAKNETERLLDLAQAGDAGAAAELGLTINGTTPTSDEIAYARQYAATGQIPTGLSTAGISFGRIQELAADLPKANGTLVNKDTGVAPDSLNATERTGYENLYNAINTDLPVMIEKFNEMQRGLSTTGLLGGVKNTLLPNDAVVRYEQAKADFLAKLLVARSGAAVTEQEYERYSKLIPGKFNSTLGLGAPGKEKLSGLQSQMETALNDKLASRGLSIYGYSEVELDGQSYKVGEIITNEYGLQGRVNPDSSITPLQ